MRLPVVLVMEEEGHFKAQIPVLPECASEGCTREEAIAAVTEIARHRLTTMKNKGRTLPCEYTLAQVEVSV